MKGLIVAAGDRDSIGRARTAETRGLMKFSGREVVKHTLDAMHEVGVEKIWIIISKESEEEYREAFRNLPGPTIEVYQGHQNNIAYGFIYGFEVLGDKEPILAVADDNIFDFSLDGLVKRFEEVGASVVAARREAMLNCDINGLRFGKIVVFEGKVIDGTLNFVGTQAVESDLISLDIYMLHPELVRKLITYTKLPQDEIIRRCFGKFYAWEINQGFWADIGKPPLLKQAQEYFGT